MPQRTSRGQVDSVAPVLGVGSTVVLMILAYEYWGIMAVVVLALPAAVLGFLISAWVRKKEVKSREQ